MELTVRDVLKMENVMNKVKDDKYKEMADNLFINGIIDEKEYTSVINKKDKNRDDFER